MTLFLATVCVLALVFVVTLGISAAGVVLSPFAFEYLWRCLETALLLNVIIILKLPKHSSPASSGRNRTHSKDLSRVVSESGSNDSSRNYNNNSAVADGGETKKGTDVQLEVVVPS